MRSYLPIIVTSFLFFSLPGITKEVVSIAPEISLEDGNGQTWNSSDFLDDKNILIFFYPAAMTGVCTKQAADVVMILKNGNQGIMKLLELAGTNPKTLNSLKKPMGLILNNFPIRKERFYI